MKVNGNPRNSNQSQLPNLEELLRKLDNGFTKNKEFLLDEYAREWGRYLASKGLKRTQMRRFYNDIKTIENKVNDDKEIFKNNIPNIIMLKAKAIYAVARQDVRVPKEFEQLMTKAVDKAKSGLEEFKGFVQFFEALVAYHYANSRD